MEAQTHNLAERLREAGVAVTLQRIEIARVLLSRPVHMAADQVLKQVRSGMPEISRATVYNTLKLFCEKRLIKELIVDPGRVFYDSNTVPHFHLYDETTGSLSDIPQEEMRLVGVPTLPPDTRLEQIDVIVRVCGIA